MLSGKMRVWTVKQEGSMAHFFHNICPDKSVSTAYNRPTWCSTAGHLMLRPY